MAADTYGFVLWIHILSAGILIGLVALQPVIRYEAARAGGDGQSARGPAMMHAARVLDASTSRLGVPALLVLFLTGLLMVVGPLARWSLFDPAGRWALLGIATWLLLSVGIGLLAGLARQARSRLALDETHESAGAAWRWHGRVLLATIVVVLFAEWLMVIRPSF